MVTALLAEVLLTLFFALNEEAGNKAKWHILFNHFLLVTRMIPVKLL